MTVKQEEIYDLHNTAMWIEMKAKSLKGMIISQEWSIAEVINKGIMKDCRHIAYLLEKVTEEEEND